MQLILHIGQPKTGTTSIQNILKINNEQLIKEGILYKTNSLNHQPILQTIQQAQNPKASLSDFIKDQIQSAKKHGCTIIILSSEALFESDPVFLKQLINIFNLDTKVIVYLKRQDLFLESTWKQWHFKNKHFKDFDDFFQKFQLKDYLETLNTWSHLVGIQNINVVPFEKRNFPEGLLKYFLKTLGLENSQIELMNLNIPKTTFGTNQGLSPKGLKFAFLARDLADGPLDYKIENFIHEYLNDIFHKEYFEDYGLFSFEQRKKFLKKWENSNKQIAQNFLHKDLLFEDPIIENKKNVDITLEDLAKVIMTLGLKIKEKIDNFK